MATIAIIDDNPEQSSTILNNMEIAIDEFKSDLKVITALPFKDPKDYFAFIDIYDVCVLILDEKLNDQPVDESGPIDYKGSDLVTFLRETLKDFPIFSITNFDTVDDLKEKYSEFEEIIKRSDFIEQTNKYFPKILRAAKNYLKENVDELSEFNYLTREISGGNKDPNLITKLQALQIKLALPLAEFDDRNAWLSEYERQINSLEKLNEIIKSKLGNKQ
jgi:hypothetical protein